MSTPYDRAKPPHPTVPEIHGCHVCGADPTHFAHDDKAVVPLCNGCDAVGLATAASFGAAVVFAVPIPAPPLCASRDGGRTDVHVLVVLALISANNYPRHSPLTSTKRLS